MSASTGSEGYIGLFFLFGAPILALAFAIYHTRSQSPLTAARDTAGITGGMSLVSAIAVERLFRADNPDSTTLLVLAIAAIPLVPRLLLAGASPRKDAMVLATALCVAMSLIAMLAGGIFGFIGSIAEPQNQAGGSVYLVVVPVGCFVWLQLKTIVGILGAMHTPTAEHQGSD